MLERMRPLRIAGFLGISGLVAAAALGDDASVLLALVAFLPVLFLLTLASPIRERISLSLAATVLGVYWIGLALANAVLLRGLDHGGALVFMVLLGTFAGDTGAYLGGRAFGTRRLAPRVSPNKTWEGLGIGMVVCIGAVWYASRTYDGNWIAGTDGLLLGRRGRDRRAARRPVRVADQARRGHEGHRRPVRRPRRRARPPRRRAVLADRRLPGLAGAAHERRRGEARPPDDRAAQRAARRAARGADPVRVPAHRAVHPALPAAHEVPARRLLHHAGRRHALRRVPDRAVGGAPVLFHQSPAHLADRVGEPADARRPRLSRDRDRRGVPAHHRHPLRRRPRVDLLGRRLGDDPRAVVRSPACGVTCVP